MIGVGVALLLALAGAAARPVAAQPEATPPAGVTPYLPPPGLDELGGTIEIDGSSTVFPIIDETRLRFAELAGEVEVRAEFSSTGTGFARFCAAEIDVAGASRPIATDEEAECAANGVRYDAFEIAYDGITVAVHPSNDFVTCLTLDQLRRLWQPEDHAETWQDLDPAWPDREISLWGPDENSGTFDFFVSAVLGQEGDSHDDYVPSEDDNVLVTGVAEHEDALGYFGYAYYVANQDRLKAVAIDAGQGCVAPSAETIAGGTYAPLSRPLYLYVSGESLTRSAVFEFMRFALAHAREVVPAVGYVPLPDAIYAAQQARLDGAAVGAVPPDGP